MNDEDIGGFYLMIFQYTCISILGFSIGSCTNITIYTADKIETQSYPGITIIDANSERHPLYVKTDGIGLIVNNGEITFGWIRADRAQFPDPKQCALMIIVTDTESLKSLKNSAGNSSVIFDPCERSGVKQTGGTQSKGED